jgi:hypothetical protein
MGLCEIRAMPPQFTIVDGGAGSIPGFGARRRAGRMVSSSPVKNAISARGELR